MEYCTDGLTPKQAAFVKLFAAHEEAARREGAAAARRGAPQPDMEAFRARFERRDSLPLAQFAIWLQEAYCEGYETALAASQ